MRITGSSLRCARKTLAYPGTAQPDRKEIYYERIRLRFLLQSASYLCIHMTPNRAASFCNVTNNVVSLRENS